MLFISLGFALYRLLRDVNPTWFLLMLVLVLVSAAVGFSNVLNSIAAVTLFRGGDFLAVVEKLQRDALAMFYLRLHSIGIHITEIFWGLWLFPFGLLVFRFGFLPLASLFTRCCGILSI